MENDKYYEGSSLMDEYITKRIANSLTKKRTLCMVRKFFRRLLLLFLMLLLTASMVWNVVGLIKLFKWIFS